MGVVARIWFCEERLEGHREPSFQSLIYIGSEYLLELGEKGHINDIF